MIPIIAVACCCKDVSQIVHNGTARHIIRCKPRRPKNNYYNRTDFVLGCRHINYCMGVDARDALKKVLLKSKNTENVKHKTED